MKKNSLKVILSLFLVLLSLLTGCQEAVPSANRGSAAPQPSMTVAATVSPSPLPTTAASLLPPATPKPQTVRTEAPTVSAAPAETPAPAPEATAVPEVSPETKEQVCTLSVSCHTILNNMERLKAGKEELVPADGIIFAESTVELLDGDSVFDLLQRELKKAKIHLEFNRTSIYNSVYIEGIHNLYEFDCGDGSGWLYLVNGSVGGRSCSEYILSPGDRVEWVYTCNLGRDMSSAYGTQ